MTRLVRKTSALRAEAKRILRSIERQTFDGGSFAQRSVSIGDRPELLLTEHRRLARVSLGICNVVEFDLRWKAMGSPIWLSVGSLRTHADFPRRIEMVMLLLARWRSKTRKIRA